LFLFSLGAIGTAVTALRLHKMVELQAIYAREPGTVHWFVVAAHGLLLSEIECYIILLCVNLPALAAWLKKRSDPNGSRGAGLAAPAHAAAAAAASVTATGRSGSAASSSLAQPWWCCFLRRVRRQQRHNGGNAAADGDERKGVGTGGAG
jgi:hypothetical protein